MAMHEPIETRRRVVAGSNRSFGIVFSCFFALVGLWPLVAQNPPRFWALGLSMFFLVGELFAPRLLSPLNRFGVALHRLLYSAFTYYIGFKVNSGEHKVTA